MHGPEAVVEIGIGPGGRGIGQDGQGGGLTAKILLRFIQKERKKLPHQVAVNSQYSVVLSSVGGKVPSTKNISSFFSREKTFVQYKEPLTFPMGFNVI